MIYSFIRRYLYEKQLKEYNERIEKEISRMDKMISELLLISRQKMHSQMEHNLFPINLLWDDVIKDALFEAEQRKIACDVNISFYILKNI